MSGETSHTVFLHERRRQAPAAILLILLKTLGLIARQAWPLILIYFLNRESSFFTYIIYVSIGIAVLSAITSIVFYFRFFFYVSDEELVIERAVIGKTRLTVPFERIQTIHFRETVLHKLFGVVGLEIDTAGSSEKEFSISALEKQQAEAFRKYLLSRKKEELRKKEGEGVPVLEGEEEETPDELLLNLSVDDLLKIGVSGNHLQTAGIIFGFLFGIYQTLQDALGKVVEEQVESVISFLFQSVFLIVLVVLPLFIIAAFFLTLLRTVLRFYNLRFFRTHNGFKVESGLLVRLQLSAITDKIQQVQWNTNPIYSLFRMYALQLKQASSSEVRRREAITVPGSYLEQIEKVREVYFPGVGELPFTTHRISRLIIWRRLLFLGLLPALALVGMTYNAFGLQCLVWLVWIPIQYIASIYYHRNWRVAVNEEGLQIHWGIWFRKNVLLQWYKVQSVSLRQSIYQRRHDIANLTFYTAAGSVRIPFLPLETARQLRDYVIYRIESDERDWM